jgi:hypothetical protein
MSAVANAKSLSEPKGRWPPASTEHIARYLQPDAATSGRLRIAIVRSLSRQSDSRSVEIVALVETAQLPESYEAAKRAIAKCARLDECSEWADKAAAIASYARQADDVELQAYA